MKRKLTELAVARATPPNSGRLELWDTLVPAFGLRVTAAGKRSWVVALRKPGSDHPVRIKIGEPGAMPLAEARASARALMADPAGVAARSERTKADTVGAVITEFIERHQKARNRSWREVERILQRELAGWMLRPIREVGRRDVLDVLDEIADRGSPVMANRALAHIKTMLAWCVERGILDASPAGSVKAPAKEASRDRVLSLDELAAVWHACGPLGWPFGPLVRLLVATGARRGEVASMRWRDVDLGSRTWMIPRELVKVDRAHVVPLSDLAVEVVKALPRLCDERVFPAGRLGSSNTISGFSQAKRRLHALSDTSDWRIHDIRRTVATALQRLGVRLEVTEAVLGHTSGSRAGIVGVYQRHSYQAEKRLALDAWATEVERILAGEPKVIALRPGDR